MDMDLINVCILTYQRGELLKACLESFCELIVPEATKVVITVIDNDAAEGARNLVAEYKVLLPFRVEYLCEPTRGIPVARNSAVEFSHEIGADYIAFIDDDEWGSKDWLQASYEYCQSKGGDIVVSGQVVSVFPDNCPEHVRLSLQRKPGNSGKELNSCATNNVLFPIRLTKALGLRFDVSNPLTGGEDIVFFTKAKSKGVKIVKCAESIVYEKVHKVRTTIRWISKRKYSTGITVCWRRRYNGVSSVSIFISSLYNIFQKLLATVFMIAMNNKIRRNRSWFKVCRAAGVMSGLFGVQVERYKVIDS
jgi:glycosyltransferase involved in cell wall biosynthesis